MTRLQSEPVDVNQTPEQVYNFLSDFNNIGKMMPEQVEKFTTDGNVCSFTIKGMATLGLAYKTKTPSSEIVMSRDGKAPFDFDLICKIDPSEKGSKLQLFLDADLNPFLKMMAEKPLTNFLNMLAVNYSRLSSAVS